MQVLWKGREIPKGCRGLREISALTQHQRPLQVTCHFPLSASPISIVKDRWDEELLADREHQLS